MYKGVNLGVFISSMMFLNDIVNNFIHILLKNFLFECSDNVIVEIGSHIQKIVLNGKQKILDISLEW